MVSPFFVTAVGADVTRIKTQNERLKVCEGVFWKLVSQTAKNKPVWVSLNSMSFCSKLQSTPFPAPHPAPSQPKVPTAKARQMHLNWSPLGFLSELSQQNSLTRCPPDV